MRSRRKKKKGACLSKAAWLTLAVSLGLLATFLAITTLYDLGVWNEFWDLFR